MIHHTTHKEKPPRRPGVMERREYLLQAASLAKRGQELPHSKLLDIDVISIRSSIRQRANLEKHIDENLSNAALARIYGVHVRTIDKVHRGETWSHLA